MNTTYANTNTNTNTSPTIKSSSTRFVPPARHFTPEDRAAARVATLAKQAAWAPLPLRQTWADEGWLRAHIAAAGLKAPDHNEPATTKRVTALLRKGGLTGLAIAEAVGSTVDQYLARNPNLPLWVAVASILEADGTYTQAAAASLKGSTC